MQPARRGVYSQLAAPLRRLLAGAVQPTAVDPIHPLAEAAVVRVAAGPDVLRLRTSCGLLVGAVHSIFPPFRWFNYSRKLLRNQV